MLSRRVELSKGQVLTARSDHRRITTTTTTALEAAAGEGRKKGKRKRRRKKTPAVPAKDPIKVSQEEQLEIDDNETDESEMLTKQDMALIGELAKFEFQTDKEMTMGVLDDDSKAASSSEGGGGSSDPFTRYQGSAEKEADGGGTRSHGTGKGWGKRQDQA